MDSFEMRLARLKDRAAANGFSKEQIANMVNKARRCVDEMDELDEEHCADEDINFIKQWYPDNMNHPYKRTAARLRYCMARYAEIHNIKDYSQATLVKKANINRGQIEHVYTGLRLPTEIYLDSVSKALNVRKKYLDGTGFFVTEEAYQEQFLSFLKLEIETAKQEERQRRHRLLVYSVENMIYAMLYKADEHFKPDATMDDPEYQNLVKQITDCSEFFIVRFARQHGLSDYDIGE